MPRRGTVTRREVLPDPVYNSKLVTQVINKVLLDGKKSVAEGIVHNALEIVRSRTGRDPVEVLQEAIQALTPLANELADGCHLTSLESLLSAAEDNGHVV